MADLTGGFDLSDAGLRFASRRLACEPLAIAHADALFEGQSDPHLYAFVPQEPLSLVELRTRFGRLASRRSPDGKALWLNWALRLQDNAVYVGSLQATVSADAMAYIAYFVFTPWQRRGFARESCAALIDFLAARGVDRFAAEMDTRNRASIALVESLGFVRVAETAGADSFKGAASDEFRYERPIS